MLNPENIHCLALNYKGVGTNNQPPLYFVKSKNSLCFNNSMIEFPNNSDKLWTEVELGIVIKENCSNIKEEEAEKYIEGFIVCGDITCKNIQGRDHHLAFSKSRKNFCPVSNEIIFLSKEKILNLKLKTLINNKITQEGFINQMYYNPYKSLSYVSSITELKKGDILLTGTPAGVDNNILSRGDTVEHFIEDIGSIHFKVK